MTEKNLITTKAFKSAINAKYCGGESIPNHYSYHFIKPEGLQNCSFQTSGKKRRSLNLTSNIRHSDPRVLIRGSPSHAVYRLYRTCGCIFEVRRACYHLSSDDYALHGLSAYSRPENVAPLDFDRPILHSSEFRYIFGKRARANTVLLDCSQKVQIRSSQSVWIFPGKYFE